MIPKKPEINVFAGPNGSGKTTITKEIEKYREFPGKYINADEIQVEKKLTPIEAAEEADRLRNLQISRGEDFSFETVLSTDRNLKLLKRAKEAGYFIRCIYVLTIDPQINIARIKSRVLSGGHDVPSDKVLSRYEKALKLLPELIEICDVCHIYDNSDQSFRIFKKRKTEYFYWENEFWSKSKIEDLTNIQFPKNRD